MRILVVEDEHRVATSIKKGLAQEKYATDVVFDGKMGLDLALGEDYDLIILDLMLPGLDGLQICTTLRKRNIQTPILILTARGQIEDRIKGLDSGADDYMIKPFSFEELLARVRALTRRPKNHLGSMLVAGSLKIDTITYEVRVQEKPIALTNKEYSVLEYLARNMGKIITKDQIINHVWDYDSNVLQNTVEVTVKNLRKRLGTNQIQTVRGFGYKLIESNV